MLNLKMYHDEFRLCHAELVSASLANARKVSYTKNE